MYFLKITKRVKNPQYDEQIKLHNDQWRYGSPPNESPVYYVEERSLEVELTDEEWLELKPRIIESFEVKRDSIK